MNQAALKLPTNLLPFRPKRGGRIPENAGKTGKIIIDSDMRSLMRRFSRLNTEADYRNRAILLLMSSTGLRAKEIVNLRFSQEIRTFDGKRAYSYVRKGGQSMITIPSNAAVQAVRKYHAFAGFRSDRFLLSLPSNVSQFRHPISTRTLQRIIDSWCICRADGKKASPHSFRHTVGQKAFIAAGSIAAQKVLGHASPVITSKFYTLPYYDGSRILKW